MRGDGFDLRGLGRSGSGMFWAVYVGQRRVAVWCVVGGAVFRWEWRSGVAP